MSTLERTDTVRTRSDGYGDVVHPGRPELLDVERPYGMPGCTNGVSARPGVLVLATAAMVDVYRERGVDHPETYVQIVVRPGMGPGSRWVHVEPVAACPADRLGYMHGGNTVDLSASGARETLLRLGVDPADLAAVRVHDRSETPADYAALSL